MHDVARVAQVSTATVSRTINHPEQVDQATRERVETAIAKLGYRRNEVARGLVSRSSRTVGLAINLFSSLYYGRLLDGAVKHLRSIGYTTVVESTGATPEGELRAIDSLIGHQCEALIIHSDALDDAELSRWMLAHPAFVVMNRHVKGHEQNCVYHNDAKGGRLVARYLTERNHTAIAMVQGRKGYHQSQARSRGFRAELRKQGIKLPAALVKSGQFSEAGGAQAMCELLDGPMSFSAVFFHNDEMAAGGIQACRQRGIDVPGTISLVGYDDLDVAHYVSPGLTTIRQPLVEIGRASARLAHTLADKGSASPASKADDGLFDPVLVERESVR